MSEETVKFALTAEDRTAAAFASVKRALGGLETAGRGVNKVFAVGIAGGLVGGVAAMGLKALETAGGLGELAEQLGVSTDALQIYQSAALQSGIRVEQLDAGVAKFSKTLGDAARGDQAAVDAFRKLGVGVLDATGKVRPAEDVMADVADAIQAISDPALRAAAATDLFGKTGQKMLPMLSGGSAGLEKFADEARQMGTVLDAHVIEGADRAADAMARLGHETQRAGQRFAAFAAPAVEAVANFLSSANKSPAPFKFDATNDVRAQLAADDTGIRHLLPSQRDQLEKQLAALESQVADQKKAAASFTPRSVDETKRIDDTVAALNREIEALYGDGRQRAINETLAKANIQVEDAEAQVLTQLAGKLYDVGNARKWSAFEARAEIKELDEAEAAERKAADAIGQAVASKIDILNETRNEIADNYRLIDALEGSTKAYERTAAEIEIVNRLRATGVGPTDSEIEQARELAGTLGEQRDKMKELKDKWDDNKQAARDMFHVIGTGLEDAFVKGGNLRDMMKGLEQDIARIAWRHTVTKPLESAFGKMMDGLDIGGMVKGLFNGPDPADGAIGGVFDGAFAAGGPVSGGGSYLVGENGPELFSPGSSGSIIPNDALTGGGQPIRIVYNIDARGADQQAIAGLRGEIRAYERRTLAAVSGLANRGGGFAKSVGRRKG